MSQITSICTIMRMLADKFVEPPMNQTFVVNLHVFLFSIIWTDGPVE
jgi:hypothetical protein